MSAGTPGGILRSEIAEQAVLLESWADRGGYAAPSLIEQIRKYDPHTVLTIARGSSDRAADYGKYLLEILLGIPAGSTSPSTVTLYRAMPRAEGVLALAVSQSGESPDIVAEAQAMRDGGALVIAITNAEESPLAAAAHAVIHLGVGPERAIAATKSFSAECAALADIAFGWAGRPADRSAIADQVALQVASPLPEAAADLLSAPLAQTGFLLCLGRGPSGPIASEGALKIMETTGVPAFGYSAADFEHGPRALVRPGVPAILVFPTGSASASMDAVAVRLRDQGAVMVAVSGDSHLSIPVATSEPLLDPIAQVISLQRIALHLALSAGVDPDFPHSLSKVTRTL